MRSPAFFGTLPDICDALRSETFQDSPLSEEHTMVLLLGYEDDGKLYIVNDHLMYVPNFLSVYGDRESHFTEFDNIIPKEETV